MNHRKESIDALWNASIDRQEALVKEYKRTHEIPSRGTIDTPEIQAEREEQKRLFAEYCKLRDTKK